MRVEIDTRDLVVLVREFTTKHINYHDLLDDIEQIITYPEDMDFKHHIDIVEL